MSETTSTTPAAAAPVAPAPAPQAGELTNAPPPASQQPLSVSEAGRLLNRQRADQARDAARRPEGRVENRAAQPAKPAEAPAAPTEAAAPQPARGDPLDAMARALGLQEGLAPGSAPGGAAPTAPMASVEIDGRSYTHDQIRAAIGQATDYTRKTQAVAEQMRAVQEQQAALSQVLPFIQPELSRLQQQIQGVNRPDVALLDTDPTRYHREHALWEAAREEQNRLGQLGTLQQQALERAMAEQVHKSNEVLTQQLPGWGDPQTRSQMQQAIASWAMERGGFQRDELRGLADHRHLIAMAKAMMWDKMVSGARTTAPVQVAPARGVPPPPAPSQRISEAEQAFGERPSVRNATALLTARRSNGGGNGSMR